MRLVNRTAELSIRLSGSFGARHRERRYAHVHFDLGRHRHQAGLTFSARGPFGPWPTSNVTRWPSRRSSNRVPWHAD